MNKPFEAIQKDLFQEEVFFLEIQSPWKRLFKSKSLFLGFFITQAQ